MTNYFVDNSCSIYFVDGSSFVYLPHSSSIEARWAQRWRESNARKSRWFHCCDHQGPFNRLFFAARRSQGGCPQWPW
jgi:hypothetical protein